MENKQVQRAVVHFPIPGLLGVAFVVLKLTHVISWSWWWVTAPFWAPFAIALVILFAAVVLIGLAAILASKTS